MTEQPSPAFKPEGYNSLSPYLIVAGARQMITLLSAVFDAEEVRRYDNPEGSIMHAELRIDDSIIMIGDAGDEYPANQLLLHVYVPDAVATFHKAIAAGCEAIEEPVRKENDPDLRGQFRDFAGNVWAIGTQH